MKKKVKEKAEAIKLRKLGYSYNEICAKLGLSKSTCSVWLRGIRLDKKAVHRLVERQEIGKRRAALTLRQYAQERDEYIKQKVDKVIARFVVTPEVGKLLCAALYWGEGEKKRRVLAFANSDPTLVKVYLTLLRRYFTIDEDKIRALLHLHSYHNVNKQKKFWAKVTGIPPERISIYRKPNSGKNIRVGYPGCISIRYFDVRLALEVKFLYNALVGKFGGVV